jgi:hypothetical protein
VTRQDVGDRLATDREAAHPQRVTYIHQRPPPSSRIATMLGNRWLLPRMQGSTIKTDRRKIVRPTDFQFCLEIPGPRLEFSPHLPALGWVKRGKGDGAAVVGSGTGLARSADRAPCHGSSIAQRRAKYGFSQRSGDFVTPFVTPIGRVVLGTVSVFGFVGEPVGIRTRDLLIKSRTIKHLLQLRETGNTIDIVRELVDVACYPVSSCFVQLPDFATPFATPAFG